MAMNTVAKQCQDFRLPIFLERKGTFALSPRYPAMGENDASAICPIRIISAASEGESSTIFMKKKSSYDYPSCRKRSLNTFPTAHDNRSLIRIFNKL